MSKFRSILLWCPLLMLSCGEGWAVGQVRAKPILKADKEYNIILLHVADHFVLTIPDGHSVDEIMYNISCSFSIGDDGALKQLQIENDRDGWSKTFDSQVRIEMWIKDAVLQGMVGVPRFNGGQLKNIRSNRKRTILFTFRENTAGNSTGIPYMGLNKPMVNANTESQIEEQRTRFLRAGTDRELPEDEEHPVQPDDKRLHFNQTPKWNAHADENMSETMQENMRPTIKTTKPPLIRQPEATPPDVPKTEVVISLQ